MNKIYEHIQGLLNESLKAFLELIEYKNNPELAEVYEAIQIVLAHTMTVEELEEFSVRDVPAEWVKTLEGAK